MSNCGEPDTENLTRRIFSSLSDVERPHCVFASGTQPMGNAGYGSAALRDAVPHELLELLDWEPQEPDEWADLRSHRDGGEPDRVEAERLQCVDEIRRDACGLTCSTTTTSSSTIEE